MPTYDYACAACGHRFEHYQSFSEALLKRCPQCGKDRLERLIGSGAGFLFKGSGFYQTDYKKAAPAEGDKAAGEGKDKAATGGSDKGADKAPGASKDTSSGKDSGSSGKSAEKPADKPREKKPGGDVSKGPAPGDRKPD